MISPEQFRAELKRHDVTFFSGVPDSLLKDFCAHIENAIEPQNHIIAANEGSAVALAAGYHLATGNIPLVYMQNSGLGNAVNSLTSLVDGDVYRIPMLLLVGWRGEPGVSDEPQHKKMGAITIDLLETLGIPHMLLSEEADEALLQLRDTLEKIKEKGTPHAIVIRRGIFASYESRKKRCADTDLLTREKALEQILNTLKPDDIVVATTGKLSRELFELREGRSEGHAQDFLTVGSMGHASQIALGIALQRLDRSVFCFDGDGAALMHMGGMAIIGQYKPKNYIHIVFNNGVHESVGGQPTAGFSVNFCDLAKGAGYRTSSCVEGMKSVQSSLHALSTGSGPHFLEIRVGIGSRENLGRPTISPQENKRNFIRFIR